MNAPASTSANDRDRAAHWRGIVERTIVSHMKGLGWLPTFDPESNLASALARVSPDLQRELGSRAESYAEGCLSRALKGANAVSIEQMLNQQLWNDLSALAAEIRVKARAS